MYIPDLAFYALLAIILLVHIIVLYTAFKAKKSEPERHKKALDKEYNELLSQLKQDMKKEGKAYTIHKPYTLYSNKRFWSSWAKRQIFWQKLKRKSSRQIQVNFELYSGRHRTFTIIGDYDYFSWGDSTYIIDPQLSYVNTDTGFSCLDYHEGFSAPVKRIIPVSDIKKFMRDSPDYNKIEYASNPVSLKLFTEGRVIEQLAQGSGIMAFLKKVTLFFIILLIVAALHFLLWANDAGIFEKAKSAAGV